MKEKKQIVILLLIIIQTASFYSCRIKERKKVDNYETVDVVIKNNSSETFYFNSIDIEHPHCVMKYTDDIQRSKEFYFSLDVDDGDVICDITMMPSGFSYIMNPADEIKLNVKLKENFNDYYKIEFDKKSGSYSKTLIGQSLKNCFFIFCSSEPFSYNSHYSDYCKKLRKYGIKLEGKQTGEKSIEFIID